MIYAENIQIKLKDPNVLRRKNLRMKKRDIIFGAFIWIFRGALTFLIPYLRSGQVMGQKSLVPLGNIP